MGERVPLNKESIGTVERAIKRSKYIKTNRANTLDTGIFKSSAQINHDRWSYLYEC